MTTAFEYYDPEDRLFPGLAVTFAQEKRLDPAEFYLILDWRAPRARTRHIRRLARKAGSFAAAVGQIASDLHQAAEPEERLELLLDKWGFRLPTASAILTVLYPETFTVYDVRVCKELGDFDRLADKRDGLWLEYQRFVCAVRAAVEQPPNLSLRDCDRTLWGRNKQRQMQDEIKAADKTADLFRS